jgi:hypothetical protein
VRPSLSVSRPVSLGRVVESVLSEGIASLVVEEVEVASEEEAVSVELFLELCVESNVTVVDRYYRMNESVREYGQMKHTQPNNT